jgi:hypothetical protein
MYVLLFMNAMPGNECEVPKVDVRDRGVAQQVLLVLRQYEWAAKSKGNVKENPQAVVACKESWLVATCYSACTAPYHVRWDSQDIFNTLYITRQLIS